MGVFQNLLNRIMGKSNDQYLPKGIDIDAAINMDEGIRRYLINLSQNLRKTEEIDSYAALVSINSHDYEEDSRKIKKSKEKVKRKKTFFRKKGKGVFEFTEAEESLFNTYLELKKQNPDLSCTPMEIPPIYLQIGDNAEDIDDDYNRYYLNLKPNNVAEFAEELLKLRYDKKQTAFKVRTTEGLKNSKHMDTIIIYEKPDDEARLYREINSIYLKRPELFDGAERNNPFCQKGQSRFVSVGKELKGTSYNNIIAQCLEGSIYEFVKKQYGQDKIEGFLQNISRENVDKIKDSLKPYILEQFEIRESTISDEVKESLGMPIKRVKEKNLAWYDRSSTTQRALEINNGKGNKINILQTTSTVDGLEKYIIQYKNMTGKITDSRQIYSEGFDFDLMLQDEEYTHMVVDVLLKESRIKEKEELARNFGVPNKISYVGTVAPDLQGKLTKQMEQDPTKLRDIFAAIKKSELPSMSERSIEKWEKQ